MFNTLRISQVEVLPDGRMDRKNAAAYIGLATKTLAMRASAGTGPKFTKLGKVWYWKQDIDAWISAGGMLSTAQKRSQQS